MQRMRLFGIGIPVVVGLIAGLVRAGRLAAAPAVAQRHARSAIADPQFGKDIGFYAFTLPFYTWLIAWLFVAIAIAFIGALITHYLFGGIRLAGRGGQLSGPARVQLSLIAGSVRRC